MNWFAIYLFLFMFSLITHAVLYLNGRDRLSYIALAGVLVFGVLLAGML